MRGMSYTEQMQRIANLYRQSCQPIPATTHQMAAWAIHEGLWQPQPDALINQCAEELARAMREEYITDPQGRPVRAKHAARFKIDGGQKSLWDDIRTAGRNFMEIAFKQRRQQIVGDCRQLKIDVDSYNENANPGQPIQLVLDFTLDVLELEALRAA
jgi:hypothetical protein